MAEPIDNRVFVLILQHPQERRERLATAPLVCAALRNAKLVAGLSWPGLSRVAGESAEPKRWAALYLGARHGRKQRHGEEFSVLDRHGKTIADPSGIVRGLRGIVLLDGTWSQAKTLWWRNPWLLKLHRIVLDPPRPARLGRLRREPRSDALSTVEAAALALRHSPKPGPQASDALIGALEEMMAAAVRRPGPR